MANTITKNQTAQVGEKYSYKYVDIAQIHDYLDSINARYIQCIDRLDGDDYIMTRRCFDNKWENEWLRGARVVNATLIGNNNPAQQQGSALTYARRYSLLMAFGLATEDDDAQSLNQVKEPTKEDATNWKFTFGKYKGETMDDILCDDEQYVEWFIANKATDYDKKCYELLTGVVLPTEEELKETAELLVKFNKLIVETNTEKEKLYEHYGVENNSQMTTAQLKDAIKIMESKKEVK